VASSKDTEITLGTAKLLGLFFGLVMVCAVFFALGYTLGRKSDSGPTATNTATSLPVSTNGSKPASASSNQPPMTFYKAVEQKDANAQLTPATTTDSSPQAGAGQPSSSSTTSSAPATQPSASNPPDPMTALPTSTYLVQVAAVSKQDDAEALVDALTKKQYPAFVASNTSTDKLYRVQVGPFGDVKEAEAMRARLVNDGYSPILKK
jgi:cell division protein FtsN